MKRHKWGTDLRDATLDPSSRFVRWLDLRLMDGADSGEQAKLLGGEKI